MFKPNAIALLFVAMLFVFATSIQVESPVEEEHEEFSTEDSEDHDLMMDDA